MSCNNEAFFAEDFALTTNSPGVNIAGIVSEGANDNPPSLNKEGPPDSHEEHVFVLPQPPFLPQE